MGGKVTGFFSARFTAVRFAVVFTLAGALGLSACAPKDEKVSNRGGGFRASTGTIPAVLGDRVNEYSRSMLIEISDVARQAEEALNMVDPNPAANKDANKDTPPTDSPQPLKTVGCKVSQYTPSAERTQRVETDIKGCKETGASFEGVQYGREVLFATLEAVDGQPLRANMASVDGKGIETSLKFNANPRDTLRVKTNRFLELLYLRDEGSLRLYAFAFESYSSYFLNVKAFTDNGTFKTSVMGLFLYDPTARRVVEFRAGEAAPNGRAMMNLLVQSARQGRAGEKVVPHQFFGSAAIKSLALDLAACSLPVGTMDVRFTDGEIGAKPGEYVTDSKTSVDSFKDYILNNGKAASTKTSAKLCSPEEQITMTEFYAGLVY